MNQITIAVVVGSLRRDSLNRKLAVALERLAPADIAFEHVEIGDLPLFDQDDENSPTAAVTRLKGQIAAATGVLFVTPEYNRSIPGVLKNALDQGSRPFGHNVWSGRPAAVIGVSPGAIGTALAQQHLRAVLAYLDMPTLGQPEAFIQAKEGLFDGDGSIGDGSRKFLQSFMDRFVAWVRRNAPA